MSSGTQTRPRLFTIPPGADFLATLAQAMRRGVLPGGATGAPCPAGQGVFPAFSGWRIFLPTRRAARALAAAMLRLHGSGAPAQLLPRILPLGDVDEDELQLSAEAEALALASGGKDLPPPAIAPLPRLFLLADLMRRWAADSTAQQWRLAAHLRAHPGSALPLARSLARLIDSFENEEQPLDAVDTLWNDDPVLAERAEHRLAAKAFLQFLAREYPPLLAARGQTGAAARRAALIRLQARLLAENPPAELVIAAGSTGSLPATAELLATIARLPNGCVVLPGLDVEMDEESWRALPPGHPQYGMKKLLQEHVGAARQEVEVLDFSADAETPAEAPHRAGRAMLLREALRPADTSDAWHERLNRADIRQALQRGQEHLHLLPAETRHQEALAIALLMRETLQQPGRTCMLVTPDRDLARAVRAELARWRITVDDSAGLPLVDTPPGMFLMLLLEAALHGFEPVRLMALLEHPFACFGMTRADCARAAADLELAVLRPAWRFDGLHALPTLARERLRALADAQEGRHGHPNARHLSEQRRAALLCLAQQAATRLQPLATALAGGQAANAAELLRTLLEVAQDIATPPGAHCLLWRGEAGEALTTTLADILTHAADAPHMTPADLAAFLRAELASHPLRPRQPAHARLSILGLLEARLLRADRIILGGLNEGIWPEVAQNDPWLNRGDREALRLPLPERRMGLSAHDFVQAAAAGEVWMTFARRIGQQPAEPSRWVVRLQAVLKAAGLDGALLKAASADDWPLALAARLDDPRLHVDAGGHVGPIRPPRPRPPVHLRPLRFSASRVRMLLRDPYAIFARQVLRLQPLDPLSPAPTPALFGTMVHAALEEFASRWPRQLPHAADEELFRLLEEKHHEYIGDAAHLAQVRGRLRRMAEAWVEQCERAWRSGDAFLHAHAECEGCLVFPLDNGHEAVISARADRLDVLADGSLRIIDYKTGTLPKRNPSSPAYDPQMDLEAAIAFAGGFAASGDARNVRELVLAQLSGGDPALDLDNWHIPGRGKDKRNVRQRADDALDGLRRLLNAYLDKHQPYLPLDHGQRERRGGDYDHLNRWREWLPLLTIDNKSDDNQPDTRANARN